MTDFTPIRNALANLLEVIDGTAASLIGTANSQRQELIALYGRMRETNADLVEFGSMVGEVGAELLDVEELCEDVAAKAIDVIESGADRLPECPYESLVDFCDECGRAIVDGEEYSFDGANWFTCADCLNAEAEQMSIDDLAETTVVSDTE